MKDKEMKEEKGMVVFLSGISTYLCDGLDKSARDTKALQRAREIRSGLQLLTCA